tara:strand:+ start:1173 stop:1493 length:321 start_codon:yes stop_codon:yes gene_type:complete
MTLMPNEIFNEVKKFKTIAELKQWMVSLGYDLNPNYEGLSDEMEHSNYQNHFHLDILNSEIKSISDDAKAIVIYNNIEEVLADGLNNPSYKSNFTSDLKSHILINQ